MTRDLARLDLCRRRFLCVLAYCLGLIPGVAQAGGTSVNIQPQVDADLQTYTGGTNYPLGGTVLTNGGVSFTLAFASASGASGTGAIQTPPSPLASSSDIPVNIPNPDTVYTLINSAFGAFGATVGSLEFKATGGLDYSVDLVEGQDSGIISTVSSTTPSGLGPSGAFTSSRSPTVRTVSTNSSSSCRRLSTRRP
jgi:hypothetical protein